MSCKDIPVQCTRCRNKHMESERASKQVSTIAAQSVCPRCGCHSYYDLTPMIAWCWASGLIEIGPEGAVPAGCIPIASGPKSSLSGVLKALARHGYGDSTGQLLVPGVPEALDQRAAGDALSTWLIWCAAGNGSKGRYGVLFNGGNSNGPTT